MEAETLGQPPKDSPEKRSAVGSAAIDSSQTSRQTVERTGNLGLRIGQYDRLTGSYSRTQTFILEKDPGVVEVDPKEPGRHVGQTLVDTRLRQCFSCYHNATDRRTLDQDLIMPGVGHGGYFRRGDHQHVSGQAEADTELEIAAVSITVSLACCVRKMLKQAMLPDSLMSASWSRPTLQMI